MILSQLDVFLDEICLQKRMHAYTVLGCDLALVDDDEPCDFYSGERGKGEPCMPASLGSECEPGLVCRGPEVPYTCQEPVTFSYEQGEPCPQPWSQDPCGHGLYCHSDTFICEPSPEVGDPCGASDDACVGKEDERTLWCDDGFCAPFREPGEACKEHRECEEWCANRLCSMPEPDWSDWPYVCRGPVL